MGSLQRTHPRLAISSSPYRPMVRFSPRPHLSCHSHIIRSRRRYRYSPHTQHHVRLSLFLIYITYLCSLSTEDKIILPDEFVVYAWHRTLRNFSYLKKNLIFSDIIGDLETLASSSNYYVAIQGLRHIVSLLSILSNI